MRRTRSGERKGQVRSQREPPTVEFNKVIDAAKRLLSNRSRHHIEGNVQRDVEALVQSIPDIGTVESQYQTGQGRADIYLPNRKVIIECKGYPKAKDPEKPQARQDAEPIQRQLDRYVRSEIDHERGSLPAQGERWPTEAGWTGIVTDGTHWHVYRYSLAPSVDSNKEPLREFRTESEPLAAFISETLGSDKVGKEWIPESPGELFSNLKKQLDDYYRELPGKAQAATETKRKLWLDMMRTSGMVPSDSAGQERLFLAHSFLIVIVRLVSHSLRNRGANELQDALSDGFAGWVLDFERGRKWVQEVWKRVDDYDWRRRKVDVLRELYHRYVNEADRKVFGEFYTPDWLAAFMVREVLDDEWLEHAAAAAHKNDFVGIGTLDPACGSGTFLYHAALRILMAKYLRDLRPVQKADVVARLVNGMDIHPVAVEMALVNLERALPGEPTEGTSALQVFLGDSLQAEAPDEQLFSHTTNAMILTSPKGNRVHIPTWLVKHSSFAEHMRRMVKAAVEEKSLPQGIVPSDQEAELKNCQDELTEVIKEEGNSVWTWYAVNLAGPHLLSKRKIDRIVANPPWVKLSDIQVESRKRVMEDYGKNLKLQAGGKQAPHLDIASFFVLRTREIYAADPGSNPGAWLVKKSAIGSGQWAPFRSRHGQTLAQSVDLENLTPFGGGDATRCCLLMEHRPVRGRKEPRLEAKLKARRKPARHDSLAAAMEMFTLREPSPPLPQAPSHYDKSKIRQGATIVPHVLLLVESRHRSAQPGWLHIKTRPSKHQPWSSVAPQKGKVPEHWIRPLHTSPDLLPYLALREPPHAIIPLDKDGILHPSPGQDCPFWLELDEVYEPKRGKRSPQTLLARLNHRGSLSSQSLRPPHNGRRMVLHPGSGDIMRAARAKAGEAVVDSTLYWFTVGSEMEAGYLVALLNAQCLTKAFTDSKESGRHFNLHPWRKVPIPRFDKKNRTHRSLAELCSSAEKIAANCVKTELALRPDLGQMGLSKTVRNALAESKAGLEIERLAARLLPKQAVTIAQPG